MANRYIIRFNKEVMVPEYVFRKFKIMNSGDELIFTTEIYETVDYSFNPSDLFKITDVEVDYLNPVGDVVNGLRFKVIGVNMKQKRSYTKDGLMITKFRLIIDVDSIKLLNENNDRIS
jgi:hypothetical protein